jgi:hypothetical protein
MKTSSAAAFATLDSLSEHDADVAVSVASEKARVTPQGH